MKKGKKTTPVIELKTLTKSYGLGDAQNNALDRVNLKVEKGEFIAIMGPSGCGKTTLLNILGLLDKCTDGEYLLDGKNVERLSERTQAKIRSSQIGIVFQSFNLINRLNVLENVALPLTYKGMRRTKRLEAASESLKNFHLQEREYYMPYQLSGGQMQRVAIARALVNKPSIILADEPTGNLDSHASHVIMEELAVLHQQGNTILMVTHNPALTSYATRVINMLDGKIASDTKIKVKFTDETAAKIPLNFRTTAKVATTDDAVIGESIAVKPAKKKAESPATKRLRKSKRSKARSKK
jgi:putative ABC transport system ATP-binding protein